MLRVLIVFQIPQEEKKLNRVERGAGEKGHMNPIVSVNSQKFFPCSLPFVLWYHPFMRNNNERYTLVYDRLRAASVLHPLSPKGSPMTATRLLLFTLSSSFHGKCIITYYFMLNLAVWFVCLIKMWVQVETLEGIAKWLAHSLQFLTSTQRTTALRGTDRWSRFEPNCRLRSEAQQLAYRYSGMKNQSMIII